MPMPDRPHVITALDPPADQPAFHAWRRSGLGPDPARVELLKESWKTLACRLVGCGPGGADVVAMRRATETTLVERTIYRDVLSHVSAPHPELLGVVDEPGSGVSWMFLEDAGEIVPDLRDPTHRALVGRWLGRLHSDLAGRSFAAALPDRSAAHYHGSLDACQSAMAASLTENEHLDARGVRVLRAALRRLDLIEAVWPRIAEGLDDLPQSLVHGDLVRKNLRLRQADGMSSIVAFDWEMAGWGAPVVDLGSIDLGAYHAEAATFWGGHSAILERLADVGRLFGLIAAISWEIPYLDGPWLRRPVTRIGVYHARLGSALVRLRPALSSAVPPRRSGPVTSDLLPAALGLPAARDGAMRGLLTMDQRGVARVIDIRHREPNVYTSSFPSEIVTCAFDDGVERRLFIKRYVPGIHDGFGYWRGGPYEARIYDDILARLDVGTPALFGSWSDPMTDQSFLALEHVDGLRLHRSAPSSLVDVGRWLGALHREGTPVATAHPSVRRYDEAFFRGWSERALRVVRELRTDADWIDALVRRFDEQMVPRLLADEPVFIHGELYPENVMVADDRICVVDWQSAAIGPGVIDLASLTEGHWQADLVRDCREAYLRARWPDVEHATIEDALETAQLYWALRWLGAEGGAAPADRHIGYLETLRTAAGQLGLVAAPG
jgi:aminoglycoside phosphotransferase (APT) family kinase protein